MSAPQPIRQNSTDKVSIGPAVALDGFTLNTALLLSTADSARAKLGDDTTVDISSFTWLATTSMDGEFDLTLTAGITDTIGPMTILIEDVSLILPIREKFYVYAPSVYDTMFADAPTLLTAKDVGLIYESTIGTATSDSDFLMDVGIVSDDSWIGAECLIEDATNGDTWPTWIVDIQQATDRVIVEASPRGQTIPFTVVATDIVRIYQSQHSRFSLDAYDPPTATELTAEILAVLQQNRGFFRLALRSDAAPITDDAAELADINDDDGSGAGTFGNVTDSQEAIRNVLPAAAGPTRAEATTDKNSILAKLPTGLTVGGRLRSAVEVVNGRLVTGTGVAPTGTEWGDGGPEV